VNANEEVIRAEIAAQIEGLPPVQQQSVLRKLKAKYDAEITALEQRRGDLSHEISAYQGLQSWLDGSPALVLEKNDCSRLHQAKAAKLDGKAHIFAEGEKLKESLGQSFMDLRHTFVIKHDWRAAFESADGLDGDVRLPYEMCAFEFRISGKSVIAVAVEDAHNLFPNRPMMLLFESLGHWFFVSDLEDGAFGKTLSEFVWQQVKAVAIALDAEVATKEVIRASHKLNEKRQKSGKPPLADYHIVDLAKRHRVANSIGEHSDRKVRLHFRRGHWRHFETYKTWIRWCLVGDPSLGFVGKHYAL